MKAPLVTSAAALLALAGYACAGTLTLDPGSPVFTPPGAFTNNSITAEVIFGFIDFPLAPPQSVVARISGAATITPPAENTVTVEIQGTYFAYSDDIVSVGYAFTTDLNTVNPAQYIISGTLLDAGYGTIQILPASGKITNGLHEFSGDFPVSAASYGSYSFKLELDFAELPATSGTLDLAIQQIDLQIDPFGATLPPPARSLNISTRGDVQTGEDSLIGGFIITGTEPKQVSIRALGPSLATQVSGVLADPVLNLFDSTNTVIATNDNWKDNSADDQATIIADGLDMYNNGSSSVEINDFESVIVQTLDPGQYTAQVSGTADGTGIGLVEVYDVDTTTDGTLANISTRGFVDTDQNVLIGGFILGPEGTGGDQLVVRAIGPSLVDKGVGDALADPTLTVMDSNANVVATNDNWGDGEDATTITDDMLEPTGTNSDLESAVLIIPQPGAYTAIVSGVSATTGVGLVEVYNLSAPSGTGQ